MRNVFTEDELFANLSSIESFDDLGEDFEEKDKINFELTNSSVRLRVDYSNFANHVFFGSAYIATNFAYNRLLSEYPIDGELKEKNEWRRVNSGFDNWFFDNYPKKRSWVLFDGQGLGDIQNVSAADHRGILNPFTSSFTIEGVFGIIANTSAADEQIFTYADETKTAFDVVVDASQDIVFTVYSGSTSDSVSWPSSQTAHHYAFQKQDGYLTIFEDGLPVISQSTNISRVLLTGTAKYFTFGGISATPVVTAEEVRFWNAPRSHSLIRKNFNRAIHANHSGGLKLYWKFNEIGSAAGQSGISKVFDYSGNEIIGNVFSNPSTLFYSGTLVSSFSDPGDPIFNNADSDVVSFVENLRTSGSFYDKENRNYILKLVPSFLVDEENEQNEETIRMLLLVARHYDRLKLYTQHLANTLFSNESSYDNAPDELLNRLADNYGVDLGSVYEGASPLQHFFGEDILATGSLAVPLSNIRNQLRRNLVNNLIYVLKTKGTRESIESSIRSLGLDPNVLNINEYAILSGGISTTYQPKTIERRVLFLSGSTVALPPHVKLPDSVFDYSSSQEAATNKTYELCVMFPSQSLGTSVASLTQSAVFSLAQSAGTQNWSIRAIRHSRTGSQGNIQINMDIDGAAPNMILSTSNFDLWDNRWVHIAAIKNSAMNATASLRVYKFDSSGEIEFSSSVTRAYLTAAVVNPPTSFFALTASIGPNAVGASAPRFHIAEFRAWNRALSENETLIHAKDLDSLHVDDFKRDLSGALGYHLKFTDFTSSVMGTDGRLHDWVSGENSARYFNLSGNSDFDFPGAFIDKMSPSYSYDVAVNNEKIRIRSGSQRLEPQDQYQDIPYISVDVSPAASLSKEIVKWFGDMSKMNNIIGQPYLRYREGNEELGSFREHFFQKKVGKKTDLSAYIQIIKWFDANFSFFLKQILPLDLVSSVSNLVVEPHVFEFNKVVYPFPFAQGASTVLSAEVSVTPQLVGGASGNDDAYADPGRFGSPVSASSQLQVCSPMFVDTTSSNGVNFNNRLTRKFVDDQLTGNLERFAPNGYGNGFYVTVITGSNHLKNAYGVNENFYLSGIKARGWNGDDSDYIFSSTAGRPLALFTGTFPGIQDQRWLWSRQFVDSFGWYDDVTRSQQLFDFGIGYSAGWGQIPALNKKSLKVSAGQPYLSGSNFLNELPTFGFIGSIGRGTQVTGLGNSNGVTVVSETETHKTVPLWPTDQAWKPVRIIRLNQEIITGAYFKSSKFWLDRAAGWGDPVSIDGYKSLGFVLLGRSLNKNIGISFGNPLDESDNVIYYQSLSCSVKFQFFNDLTEKDNASYELVLSSSLNSSGDYETKGKEASWELIFRRADISGDLSDVSTNDTFEYVDFARTFERNLPPNFKYMRTYVDFNLNGNHGSPTVYPSEWEVQILGRFSKEPTTIQENILNVRSNQG